MPSLSRFLLVVGSFGMWVSGLLETKLRLLDLSIVVAHVIIAMGFFWLLVRLVIKECFFLAIRRGRF